MVRVAGKGPSGKGIAFSPQATPRAGASTLQTVKGGRKSHWRSSRRRQAKVRSPLPVPTPKSPLPLQKTRPRSSPDRTSPSIRAATHKNMPRSPSAGKEARRVFPSAVTTPGSPHVARQVAIRGSHSETPMDKRVSFRKSEERKIPQRRSPWGDRKKSQ